ncbi:MAG: hypothetical protein IH991_17730 [Planctomycetes bacterium]|nr:hypothetical protein [Planctomycetota bacterium]
MCDFEFDAVGRWSVGGYTDHKERHCMLIRSQIDGSISGHIDCPMCESTIMLC